MATLRILGLDDDNHSPMWVCEDGTVFSTAKEFMEFLAKPHDVQCEIKMFAIVDEWSEELAAYEEEFIDHMFGYLEGVCRQPEGKEFDEVFNLFWESANRLWW